MKALILAAGLGTRLRPYTLLRPKPLFTIDRRTVLDLLIEKLAQSGCDEVMVNTHHLDDQIEATIKLNRYPIPVYTRYEPEILGTGGAIGNLVDFWDEQPFMVVNGDIVTTIDFKAVYAYHQSHESPVTLVLYDAPEFNTVAIDRDHRVIRFGKTFDESLPQTTKWLTFTGIQVLDPMVLNYIPRDQFFSSITAYQQMIDDHVPIQAMIVQNGTWSDIGTPQRYRRTAVDVLCRRTFERIHGRPIVSAIEKIPLTGDGSDRRWYRICHRNDAMVLCDHGIRESETTSEADAFVAIGNHLRDKNIPVPKIFGHDTFSGLVIVEDLGNTHFQQLVGQASHSQEIVSWYQKAIDLWARMAVHGADGFDPGWTCQTARYDRQVILDLECHYFVQAFVRNYMGLEVAIDGLAGEFDRLAQATLANAVEGFIHRDFQSRNLMVKNGQIRIIDFQGGRMGPIQYDLASLLIDPYVSLTEKQRQLLLGYALEAIGRKISIDPHVFVHGYHCCTLTRNLQILGAFGFLTRVKNKPQFEMYIPRAITTLHHHLQPYADQFPELFHTVNQCVCRLNCESKIHCYQNTGEN